MRRMLPFLAALAVWGLGLAGCTSQAPLVPKSIQTVTLSADNLTPVVSLPVITAVKFVIPGPTKGSQYAWFVVGNNIKTLVQTSDMAYVVDPSKPEGGYSTATFYGLKPGRSVLRLVLIKPNDKIAVPVGHFTVVVLVKDTDEK